MKKLLSLVIVLAMLLSAAALAEDQTETLPFVTEPTELTIAIPQSVRVLSYDDNYMTKMCEEETGLDLVFQLLPGAETAPEQGAAEQGTPAAQLPAQESAGAPDAPYRLFISIS